MNYLIRIIIYIFVGFGILKSTNQTLEDTSTIILNQSYE
jgi:hypothetical protein